MNTDKPIPKRHATRYKLAQAQLSILPASENDPDEDYIGIRAQCIEVTEFCEELGTAESLLRDLARALQDADETIRQLINGQDPICIAQLNPESWHALLSRVPKELAP